MKKSCLVVIALSFVLIMGILFAGCIQPPSGNGVQLSVNTPTPAQTQGQSGNGVQTGTPGAMTTQNAGQNYNPAQTGETQRTYVVADTIAETSPSTVTIIFQGGMDAALLQSISISVNGVDIGSMGPVSGAASLPVGFKQSFPAGIHDHIVGVGHFSDGGTQVIIDTTF